MVDRINKSLLKMSVKDRDHILEVLACIERGAVEGFDLKKLKGYDSAYRVRKGSWRIIFHRGIDGKITVLSVDRRSESTYRDF